MRNPLVNIRAIPQHLPMALLQAPRLLLVIFSSVLCGSLAQSTALAIGGAADSDSFESVLLSTDKSLSYALFKANGSTLFSGELNDLGDMKAAAKQRATQGEYLVVRRDKQNYYIDDAALLTKIKNEWKPLEPFEQEMEQLSAQMEQHQLGLDIYQEELDTYLDVEGEVDEVFMAEFEARHKTFEKEIKPITARMEVLGKKIETLSDTAHANVTQMILKALDSGVAKKLS